MMTFSHYWRLNHRRPLQSSDKGLLASLPHPTLRCLGDPHLPGPPSRLQTIVIEPCITPQVCRRGFSPSLITSKSTLPWPEIPQVCGGIPACFCLPLYIMAWYILQEWFMCHPAARDIEHCPTNGFSPAAGGGGNKWGQKALHSSPSLNVVIIQDDMEVRGLLVCHLEEG